MTTPCINLTFGRISTRVNSKDATSHVLALYVDTDPLLTKARCFYIFSLTKSISNRLVFGLDQSHYRTFGEKAVNKYLSKVVLAEISNGGNINIFSDD